jgi:hypothetical protein
MTPQQRAQLQNEAIDRANAYLSAVGLPSYTEAITTLSDLLTWSGNAPDVPPATIAAAHELIDRASGSSPPPLWMQRLDRVYRPDRDPKAVALAISPICKMEDVTPGTHSRIKVPADKLEAVRKAVELVRSPIHYIEYLPLETDK